MTAFGDRLERDIDIKDMYAEVSRKYEVYHLNIKSRFGNVFRNHDTFESVMGDHAIKVEDYKSIPEVIISILQLEAGVSKDEIIDSWDGSTKLCVSNALSALSTKTSLGVVEF